MSRTVAPIDRAIYDGRDMLGSVVTAKRGEGFDAFDANGAGLGRFTTEAAAARAVYAAHQETEVIA